jgi:hypothetical protein
MGITVQTRGPRFRVRMVTRRLGQFDFETPADSVVEISVQRRLGQPAGSFQLVLVPRPLSNILNSEGWQDAFDPMDYVEVFAWAPPRLPDRPIVRGWVDHIGEQFVIAGGHPTRAVVIVGRDYGKLLLNTKLYWVDSDYIQVEILRRWQTGFKELFGWKGGPSSLPKPEAEPLAPGETEDGPNFTPAQILEVIHRQFYQPQEALVLGQFGNVPPELHFRVLVDDWEEQIRTYTPSVFQKSMSPFTDVAGLMYAFQHRPWRELFVKEGITSPILQYRPAPWLDINGSPVQPLITGGPPEVGEYQAPWPIGDDDLMEYDFSRSDASVLTWFFTYPEMAAEFGQMSKQGAQALEGTFSPLNPSAPLLPNEPTRADYRRFGFRLGEFATPFLDFERKLKQETLTNVLANIRTQGEEGNYRLYQAYGHEHLLEYGALTIKGDERIQIGDYIRLTDRGRAGTAGPRYYVEGVLQKYRHGTQNEDGHFITHLEVSRGRGHLVRKYGKRG